MQVIQGSHNKEGLFLVFQRAPGPPGPPQVLPHKAIRTTINNSNRMPFFFSWFVATPPRLPRVSFDLVQEGRPVWDASFLALHKLEPLGLPETASTAREHDQHSPNMTFSCWATYPLELG